ncbi:MAG: FtsW/RodA/SpoVE family cell cycle protein [Oscillospiraceae bacterium]|jgi:rod shape determining protein RodA|nr:FtsW/RodA/SpoVE family cell cycle protein [Oscillospiraceae bacterium]
MAVVVTFFRAALRFLREADILLLLLSIIGAVYGIVLINSIVKNFNPGNNEIYVQIGAMIIGLFLFVLFSYIDIDIIADKSRFLFLFCIVLISTLVFWGEGGDDVGRNAWLRFFNIGIQPAEITKVPYIIIVARMITNFKERKSLNSVFSILQIVVVFVIIFGFVLIISEDMGTALVYFGILAVMLFAGGVKLRWFAIGAAAITIIMPLAWDNFLSDKQKNRIRAPFFPEVIDPTRQNELWQPDQSVEAIATGGFMGQGLGNGRLTQTPRAIPAQHTDFIFSAAGEELGFVGCLAIILLLVLIIARCVYVGVKSNNPLGMLICIGVAGMLITQMVENIGMALGLMPVIGITLPFFSYGGSSLVTCFAAMGIVSGIKMRPKPVRFRNL